MITSIELSEKLNVVHRHLLRVIRKIEVWLPTEVAALWQSTAYRDSKNRAYPLYVIYPRGALLLLFQLSIEPKTSLGIIDSLEINDNTVLMLSGLQVKTNTEKEITYVYFITDKSKVKIGIAKDTKKRIKQLQTSSSSVLYLYKHIALPDRKTALQLEYRLHKKLSSFRVEGTKEWFDVTPEHAFALGQALQQEMVTKSTKKLLKKVSK